MRLLLSSLLIIIFGCIAIKIPKRWQYAFGYLAGVITTYINIII
jgi:hypothetical protein